MNSAFMTQRFPLCASSDRFLKKISRRGFTLIELLTVIAIIAILAAILVPVVGKVRASAKKVNCLSNLREIGKQIALYANDNKQMLPKDHFNIQGSYTNGDAGTQTAGGQSRITGRTGILAFYLYPYTTKVDSARLGTAGLAKVVHPNFICPSLGSVDSTSSEVPGLSAAQALSYGLSVEPFNSTGSPYADNSSRVFNHTTDAGDTSGGLIESRYPCSLSRVWAVTDIDSQMASGWSTAVMPTKPIHGSVRNRVYLDGHVKSVPLAQATSMPWE